MAFATKLWTEILDYCTPRLIITIDQRTTRCLLGILNGTRSRRQFEVGWGTFSADVFAYQSVTLLRLPHLSRFPIFGREASRPYVERIVAAVREHLVGPP